MKNRMMKIRMNLKNKTLRIDSLHGIELVAIQEGRLDIDYHTKNFFFENASQIRDSIQFSI